MDTDDHALAVALQEEEYLEVGNAKVIEPFEDVHSQFVKFNSLYFNSRLGAVSVEWSARMTLCAGLCEFRKGAGCRIKLSQPLLQFRTAKEVTETLLHEMIHAYLFLTTGHLDRDGHGPDFQEHMFRINQHGGYKITIYHSFHEEVDHYRVHWWKCQGKCGRTVKRAMNRAPGPYDWWWNDHVKQCGGSYLKIKEPPPKVKPPKKRKSEGHQLGDGKEGGRGRKRGRSKSDGPGVDEGALDRYVIPKKPRTDDAQFTPSASSEVSCQQNLPISSPLSIINSTNISSSASSTPIPVTEGKSRGSAMDSSNRDRDRPDRPLHPLLAKLIVNSPSSMPLPSTSSSAPFPSPSSSVLPSPSSEMASCVTDPVYMESVFSVSPLAIYTLPASSREANLDIIIIHEDDGGIEHIERSPTSLSAASGALNNDCVELDQVPPISRTSDPSESNSNHSRTPHDLNDCEQPLPQKRGGQPFTLYIDLSSDDS